MHCQLQHCGHPPLLIQHLGWKKVWLGCILILTSGSFTTDPCLEHALFFFEHFCRVASVIVSVRRVRWDGLRGRASLPCLGEAMGGNTRAFFVRPKSALQFWRLFDAKKDTWNVPIVFIISSNRWMWVEHLDELRHDATLKFPFKLCSKWTSGAWKYSTQYSQFLANSGNPGHLQLERLGSSGSSKWNIAGLRWSGHRSKLKLGLPH